ncbi:MAG TPA: globin domain-containing protein [Candidatus Limnocylindria bacterium]|nr:globin domain-containing protein [Candidatus Limnocylindria bacterium]
MRPKSHWRTILDPAGYPWVAHSDSNRPLTPGERAALRESWSRVEPLADVFALSLYRHLFEKAPQLRPLFHTNIETQGRRVFDTLGLAVSKMDDWARMEPMLEALGRRHRYVGVEAAHFRALELALMLTLEEILGAGFTLDHRTAWQGFFAAVETSMVRGLESVGDTAQSCDTTRFFRA